MRKSRRGKTRQRSSSSRGRDHGSKRDLSEDLYRFDASITEQPELFSATGVSSPERDARRDDYRKGEHLTRFQRREIGIRRLGHFVQFVILLAVLTALILLLLHSITLHF